MDTTASSIALRVDRADDVTLALVALRSGLDGEELGRGVVRRQGSGSWTIEEDGLAPTDIVDDLCRARDTWLRVLRTADGMRVESSADGLSWDRLPVEGMAGLGVSATSCAVVDGQPLIQVVDLIGGVGWLTAAGASGVLDGLRAFDPVGDPSVEIGLPSASVRAASLRVLVPSGIDDALFLLPGDGPEVRFTPGFAAQRYARSTRFEAEFAIGTDAFALVVSDGRIDVWKARLPALEVVGELPGLADPVAAATAAATPSIPDPDAVPDPDAIPDPGTDPGGVTDTAPGPDGGTVVPGSP